MRLKKKKTKSIYIIDNVSDEEIVDEVKDEVEKEKNKKYLYHR